MPRGSVLPQRGTTTVFVPNAYDGGFWPWGFGGLGFGSYYGGFGSYYGGSYDPYFPWFGAYSGYGYSASSVTIGLEGSLRLKIKPRNAQVYVDGYYVGIVDDFDGILQRLHVEAGPHRIEVRAPEYETLTFEVSVRPDETTKYEGDLKRVQ